MALPGFPGPGLAFIFLGLLLADVPGKRRLLARLVRAASTRRRINRVRDRFGRPRMTFPPAA